MNLAAAALTATGLLVKAVRDEAASYTTVEAPASSRSKINRRYRAYHIVSGYSAPSVSNYQTNLVLGVLNRILANELEFDKLKKLLCIGNAFKNGTEVNEGSIVVNANKSGKTIPSANTVTLSLEESRNEFGGIWNQGRRVQENGGDGKNGVFSDVGMSVFETGSC